MCKLLKYELKKVFDNKLIYILLIIFPIVSNANVIIPLVLHPEEAIVRDYAYENILEQYGGRLTQDTYDIIMDEYNTALEYYNNNDGVDYGEPGRFAKTRIMDYYTLLYTKSNIDYIIDYNASNKHTLEQAKSNIALYTKRQDTYMTRVNQLILKIYSEKPALKLMDTKGWNYLGYNLHVFFMLIMLIIFIAPIFSAENENKMYPLIYSSLRGKKSTLFAKLFTSIIFCVFINFVFALFNLLLWVFYSGLGGFSEYVQNYSVYSLCPYNIKFGELILIHALLITLGTICIALIICLVSIVCKNTIVSISVSSVVVIGIYAFVFLQYLSITGNNEFLSFIYGAFYQNYLSINEKFLFTGLFEPHRYFTGFHSVNFFQLPVLSLYFNVVLSLVKCVLLVTIISFLYCKPRISLRKKNRY